MDDQNDVDRTLSIMDELFYKHHVCAILGPISSKLVVPMGKKAHELGIPLLTLAQQEALASSFVFNTGLSPAIQIHALVSYVRKNLPLNNFAILTPASKFGEEYSKVFWDELDRAGGVVRGYETYTADETDFRSNIDKLIGLASPDARSIELEELEQLKNSMPVKNRSKKWEKMFQLKPIVDFEAVFIPEEPKTLGQILPTFAYRDVEKIVFLGINTWNSPELLTRAGGFAEGSVFVDGFFAASTKPSIKKFVQEYQKTFGSEPALVEQVAYDASNILATILSSGAIASREELQDKLTHLHSFPGISGNISFQNGRFIKFIHLLTVKKNKIEEIVF
jgi:ABC-type branched-subunit amino acid transport system substrate-binding protein